MSRSKKNISAADKKFLASITQGVWEKKSRTPRKTSTPAAKKAFAKKTSPKKVNKWKKPKPYKWAMERPDLFGWTQYLENPRNTNIIWGWNVPLIKKSVGMDVTGFGLLSAETARDLRHILLDRIEATFGEVGFGVWLDPNSLQFNNTASSSYMFDTLRLDFNITYLEYHYDENTDPENLERAKRTVEGFVKQAIDSVLYPMISIPFN